MLDNAGGFGPLQFIGDGMANLTREQRAAREALKEDQHQESAAVPNELVTMAKGDERIDVHPTCVKAHENAGWKVSA